MVDRKDAGRICDDTTAGDNGPPAGGKRRLIREGGSASRVSNHARPRDPGGGTVSTVSPRRTIIDDVSLAVEQSRLVSSGCSTVQTEKALAEDTHGWECPHDVVGLHAHKGTMWMSNERAIDLSSIGTVPLRNVPDVFGMSGRRDSATESRILQGRDARSVRVLVPDCHGLDKNFHDVTVVDMGDLPESLVSIPELSELARRWPPAVITHMRWRQPELEEMKQVARVQTGRNSRRRVSFVAP